MSWFNLIWIHFEWTGCLNFAESKHVNCSNRNKRQTQHLIMFGEKAWPSWNRRVPFYDLLAFGSTQRPPAGRFFLLMQDPPEKGMFVMCGQLSLLGQMTVLRHIAPKKTPHKNAMNFNTSRANGVFPTHVYCAILRGDISWEARSQGASVEIR